jgi:hypothetical protein
MALGTRLSLVHHRCAWSPPNMTQGSPGDWPSSSRSAPRWCLGTSTCATINSKPEVSTGPATSTKRCTCSQTNAGQLWSSSATDGQCCLACVRCVCVASTHVQAANIGVCMMTKRISSTTCKARHVDVVRSWPSVHAQCLAMAAACWCLSDARAHAQLMVLASTPPTPCGYFAASASSQIVQPRQSTDMPYMHVCDGGGRRRSCEQPNNPDVHARTCMFVLHQLPSSWDRSDVHGREGLDRDRAHTRWSG